MKIHAAVYGDYVFNFLAHGVKDTDGFILARIVEDVTKVSPKVVGFYKNGFGYGEHGDFYVSSDLNLLKKNIPISMRPYAERLAAQEPLYLTGKLFKPKDELLHGLFGCFSFPPILIDSEEKFDSFKERFPNVEAAVRSNSEEILAKGRALLLGGIPELEDYL